MTESGNQANPAEARAADGQPAPTAGQPRWRPRPRRVPLASRTLLHDPLRLVIGIGAIGAAILMVLLLEGIRVGTVAKSTTYIDHVGADVFVMPSGVDNMALTASVLPAETVGELAKLPGVRRVAGIIRAPIIASNAGTRQPADLIGYNADHGLGGPWLLAEGRINQAPGEAVVDRHLAAKLDLGVGDEIQLSGARFAVVGLSDQTTAIAGKLVFVSLADAEALTGASGLVNFALVQLENTAESESFARSVPDRLPGLIALPRERLSENDRQLLGGLFIDPVRVMSTVGLIVGLAIIGLTMYTTTAERLRDFGVLKAIGASDTFLFRTVITQAAIFGLSGFVVGLGGTALVGPLVVRLVPDIGVIISTSDALRTLGFVLAMSVTGAVLPVARIVSLDPLVVFRR